MTVKFETKTKNREKSILFKTDFSPFQNKNETKIRDT